MPAKKAPKTQEQRLDRICELNDEAKELKVVIDALKADLLVGMQSDEVKVVESSSGNRATLVEGKSLSVDVSEMIPYLTPAKVRKLRSDGVLIDSVSVPALRDAMLKGDIPSEAIEAAISEVDATPYVKVTPAKP